MFVFGARRYLEELGRHAPEMFSTCRVVFKPRHLRADLSKERRLLALDLNVEGQLELLDRFRYASELDRFPRQSAGPRVF